ncbi:MAG: hypothetical protein HYY06_00240 [Deltaproteobacteria bacterium]|nr:hypothetical protein [Deltaproteobacteria bacterium]
MAGVAAALWACGAGDPVRRAPPVSEGSGPSAPPAEPVAAAAPEPVAVPASGSTCRWRIPAPVPLGLTALVVPDPAHVFALAAGGRAYRLARDRWEPLGAGEAAPRPPSALPDPSLPPGCPIADVVRAVRTRDGAVVVLDGRGEIAVWRRRRTVLRERDVAGVGHGWIEEPHDPGWLRAQGTAPPDAVALVAVAEEAFVATRAGGLVRVSLDTMLGAEVVRPIVHADARRVLRLLPLRDGAVLVVRHDALLVAPAHGAVRPVAAEAAWIESLDPTAAAPLLVAAVGSDGALVAQHSEARLVTTAGPRRLDLARAPDGRALGELMGLASGGGTRWVAATLTGEILAGDGESLRVAGRIQELDQADTPTPVAFPLGAFGGADGRVRVADRHRRLGCVEAGAALSACGPVPRVAPRQVHQLDDGLVVETQEIRTAIVAADGLREVPSVPGADGIYAGTSAAPVAIARDGREVLRLDAGAWRPVVALPDGLSPTALATRSGEALVGGADGSVVACPMP